MKKIFLISLVSMLLFTGCAFFQSKAQKSVEELVNDGMEDFEDGKYRNAIKSFETLKDWYPFSKYAILAELKIGDSYYHLKEYEQAIFAYEEFENLHPRNDAIPYVLYQIGRSYFDQMDTVDRDQSSTRKALETFDRLIKTFPENEYARKAKAHQTQCYKILAGHDLYVGMFYYKNKHYKAALNRFKSVLYNYPDVGVHQFALMLLPECETSIKNIGEKKDDDKREDTSESTYKKFLNFWKNIFT
ncbi:MAG TPA: outer membrane protein assembly factor BamD [Deltaproteobacteria bacterium]|nr:outer membrane protein assembly factor BamD [Deltaproteobacteria bacterium]